jgi:hypothetical protein
MLLEEENLVLDFVRKNIPLERVIEVEKQLPDLEGYVERLTETIYRSHKGSWKVDSSKARGVSFLQSILYLLTGEPIKKRDWAYWDERFPHEIKKVFRKHFDRGSYFRKYAVQYFKARVGRKTDGYVRVDPYVFKLIGGEVFFYHTLKALLKVIRRAHEDPKYDYQIMSWGKGSKHSFRMMTWEEGITEYLISELKAVKNV